MDQLLRSFGQIPFIEMDWRDQGARPIFKGCIYGLLEASAL